MEKLIRLVRLALPLLAGLMSLAPNSSKAQTQDVKVMSLNVWNQDSNKTALANIVNAGGADIVGIQEMNSAADGQALAAELGGWHYFNHGGSNGILSRFPIIEVAQGNLGAKVEITPGHSVWVFNTHLRHYPYGPYQLAGIPYNGGALYNPNDPVDIAAVVQDQVDGRGAAIASLLSGMQPAQSSGLPVFLTGDFNEASHLDWTEAAATAGVHAAAVPWPTSTAVQNAGLTDSYRQVHPDEVTDPGNTWSPVLGPSYVNNGVFEPQDRIDFVYYDGPNVLATDSMTVGPSDGFSDMAVADYVSDHRGVVSGFAVSELQASTLTFSRLGKNNDLASNAPIVDGYGDRLTPTPNVEVEFSASIGSRWDAYDGDADNNGVNNWNVGVAQLQSLDGAVDFFFDVTFMPDAGFGVVVDGFELLDYADSNSAGHTVNWELWNGAAGSGSLLAHNTAGPEAIGAGANEAFLTGYATAEFGPLTLRIEHLTGARDYLAIDNVRFRQVTGVPEPAALLFLTGSSMWLFVRRQRRFIVSK